MESMHAIQGKNILVTGGAGFIGSNISRLLVENGCNVRVFDNLCTGRYSNIESIANDIEFIEGSLKDLNTLKETLKDIDIVFHQGAIPSVPRSIEDPLSTNEANITGTLNLLNAALEVGVERLVYASSSSVYGDSPILPKDEIMPVNPCSPYALSKYSAERYCQLFFSIYGLQSVCLRYFNVFGPRQDPTSNYAAVIPRFISSISKGDPVIVFGDGLQTRDFTFVENVIEANLAAAVSEKGPGEVFNIACGNSISILDLADSLMEIIGRKVHVVHEEALSGEVRHSRADISKARSILGYNPKTDVYSGLQKTVDWFM